MHGLQVATLAKLVASMRIAHEVAKARITASGSLSGNDGRMGACRGWQILLLQSLISPPLRRLPIPFNRRLNRLLRQMHRQRRTQLRRSSKHVSSRSSSPPPPPVVFAAFFPPLVALGSSWCCCCPRVQQQP